ncbi:MAG: hypothetical protein M3220_11330 [Chloroflexota bacterium]|nr:hypothetical protein [Chloroflexota bacterium]
MDELTPVEKLMAEVAANMIAITEEETWKIVQPPSGPMSEVGHYHTLNKRNLRRKELDAIQRVLDDVAYNTAAMVFALLDGRLDTEEEVPQLKVVEETSGEPIADSMHGAFLSIWEDEEEDEEA